MPHTRDIGLSAPELQRRALRAAAWSSVSSMLGLPLAVVVSVVLARSLGPREYGRFAYLTFLVPLLYEATDLGVAQATVREASRAFASGSVERTRELIGKAVGWNLLRLPVVVGAVLLVARPSLPAALAVASFLVLAMAGGGLAFALNAENRGAVAAKLGFLQGLATAGAAMGTALAGASGTTVWAAAWSSGAVVLPVSFAVANPALRRGALRPRLPRRLPLGFWRFGMGSAAVSILAALVFSRSEVVILDAFGKHQALAVFALAYGLAQRLTTPVDTMLGPLVLAFSALDAAHPERLRPGFERALRVGAVGCAFVAAGALAAIALLAPLMYGGEYAGVGVVFAVLALVSLVQSAAQPYVALAYARARAGVALRAYGVALGADCALTVALVPVLGVWGAVVGNVLGGFVAVALLARAAAGPASLRRAGVPALKLAAVTAVACGAAYGAGAAVGRVEPLLGVGAAVAIGIGLFLAGARGVLADTDATALTASLPRRLARGARVVALLARPAV